MYHEFIPVPETSNAPVPFQSVIHSHQLAAWIVARLTPSGAYRATEWTCSDPIFTSMSGPTREQKHAWHSDPANWRWGVFYYNPADKRLLPPKRIPLMGWTVNFANPRSVMLLVVILVVCCLLALIGPTTVHLPG